MQLKYSNYAAFSHVHGVAVNNSGLIIDDLGVERSSEYALENIFSVIDWRYRSGKPLIITTNLPLAQLKQETKIEKKTIYDRILERCIPVKIDGVSRREAMANDNMQTMKSILKI